MKFTINSGDLLQRLNILAKAQAPKNALPILDCIKFELHDDNTLSLTASDSENTLITTLSVIDTEDTNQSICIASAMLINALRELPNQPIVVAANDQTFDITITYQGGFFKMVGQDAGVYPFVNFSQEGEIITLSGDILSSGLKNTKDATASDELRPIMCGTLCEFTADNRVNFVASDGHKLIRDSYTDINNTTPCDFVLSDKASTLLQAILAKGNDDVQISASTQSAVIETPNYKLYTRLIEGRFPNYNSVIPTENPFKVRVENATLIAALRRVLVFASASTALVKLQATPGQLQLSAQDLDFSTAGEETIPCEYEGSKIAIGFHGAFLLDQLRVLPSTDIIIHLADPSRAALFTPVEQAEGNNILCLLMPMMLKN